MRRSFGPGMGSGGGRGGGGMMKTIHRAVRTGHLGGGASSQEHYSPSATTTSRTTTNRLNPPTNNTLSLSSNPNNLNHHVSAGLPAPPYRAFPSSPTAGDEFDWEYIDGEMSVNDDHFVFGSVPSKEEVQDAVSSLHEVLEDPMIIDDGIGKMLGLVPGSFQVSESGMDWIEPSLQLSNSTSTLHDHPRSTTVYDAFHLLQADPSVQRMVISLSSDKAVWDAVMSNEVVRELRESINEGKSISECSEDSVDDSNPVTQVLRWIFVNTKEKAIEIIENISKIVNELVRPMDKDENPNKDTHNIGSDSFEGKLRSSFLLSIMVLLIVVVSRSRKC